MKTRNIVGNVPEPNELYGRQALIGHLWRQIQGNNVLLLAPRRFGKTGVMHHVLKRPHPGYLPVYFDLEDVDGADEFLWRVTKAVLALQPLRALLRSARKLPDVIGAWVKDTFDEFEFEGARVKFKAAVAEDWRAAATRLLSELEKSEEVLIFVFDELPAMLDKIRPKRRDNEARDFMAWFRTVRMQHKDRLRRHRFLVGGSIGIDVILRRLDAPDKLNDFERIYVGPIPPDDAVQLVKDLAESMEIDLAEDLVLRILDLVGPHVPYFIHLLFSQLAQLAPSQRQPLTRLMLDDVYEASVLGPACKRYFDHYRTRLLRYGKLLETAATAVLQAVAQAPLGRMGASALYDVYRKARKRGASETEFDELMADLECEWYVVLDPRTNEYHFMLAIMSDWWRRWYGALRRSRSPENE